MVDANRSQRTILPGSWGVANMLGAALSFALLSNSLTAARSNAFPLLVLSIPTALLAGLIAATLQWWVLRNSPLQPGRWWIGASVVGWMLQLLFLFPALAFFPTSSQDLFGLAYAIDMPGATMFRLVLTYLMILVVAVLFGLLGQSLGGLPTWLLLRTRRQSRERATRLYAGSVWGSSIGLALSAGLFSLPLLISNLLPVFVINPPAWLALFLLGAGYGLVSSWFSEPQIYASAG